MQYLVVIEQGPTGFGAYVPDLPGCIAAGESKEEVTDLVHEAIELPIEDMRAQGQEVPVPTSTSELVEIAA